jgi:hypothetical protein
LGIDAERGLGELGRRQARLVDVVDRPLVAGSPSTVVIDQQVAGDREQPGARRGALGVVAPPSAQRPLERELAEILGLLAPAETVGEEAVDLADMGVVEGCEVLRARSAGPSG